MSCLGHGKTGHITNKSEVGEDLRKLGAYHQAPRLLIAVPVALGILNISKDSLLRFLAIT